MSKHDERSQFQSVWRSPRSAAVLSTRAVAERDREGGVGGIRSARSGRANLDSLSHGLDGGERGDSGVLPAGDEPVGGRTASATAAFLRAAGRQRFAHAAARQHPARRADWVGVSRGRCSPGSVPPALDLPRNLPLLGSRQVFELLKNGLGRSAHAADVAGAR